MTAILLPFSLRSCVFSAALEKTRAEKKLTQTLNHKTIKKNPKGGFPSKLYTDRGHYSDDPKVIKVKKGT